jgi:hypothetical protein
VAFDIESNTSMFPIGCNERSRSMNSSPGVPRTWGEEDSLRGRSDPGIGAWYGREYQRVLGFRQGASSVSLQPGHVIPDNNI